MKMCTQYQWLQEKAIEASRMAISANKGTPQGDEWRRIMLVLKQQQVEHCIYCNTCSEVIAKARRG